MTPEPARCPITPATKVAELLESWPELEVGIATRPPDWVSAGRVVVTIDAEALLEAGEVPLPVVNEKARGLGPGELLRIDSVFRPAPLVEALSKQGFRFYVREAAPGRFETLVSRG